MITKLLGTEMDKITMKLHRKQFFLYEVAEEFGYSIKEFLSYGLIGNLRIAVNIIGDGLFYVCKKDLEKYISTAKETDLIKLTELYPVDTHKTVYPPEHEANIGNDIYAYEDLTVHYQELIVFKHDLKQLFDDETHGGVNLSNQKKNQKAAESLIDRRLETSLYNLIACLEEIICGGFFNKEIEKHPSIRDRKELIEILSKSDLYGLKKRNLEKIFPLAKRIKTSQ